MHPLVGRVQHIEGWLNDDAAELTIEILRHQDSCAITGPLLELGVFRGKYLALVYAASAGSGDRVIGIDAFFERIGVPLAPEWRDSSMQSIREAISQVEPDLSRLEIIAADTTTLDTAAIAQLAGATLRFVSVDGGHDADTVYHDLTMVAPRIRKGAVLALDDVFNALVPGVGEGVCRFFSEQRAEFAAFATCGNKLFVTTRESHDSWVDFCRELLQTPSDDPYRQRSRDVLQRNVDNRFTPRFFGDEVLTFQ